MRINGQSKPYKISAYAIDPDTARTALASNVDKKYLVNNAPILSVSFLQSYFKPYPITTHSTSHNAIKPLNVKINKGKNIAILFMPQMKDS
jgi:hypothetical protein